MKRYRWIWDKDGFWFYAVEKGTPLLEDPPYEMVLASDVAKLEGRYREAVDALVAERDAQCGEIARLREALEIIAGYRPCVDDTMSDVTVAREALRSRP